MISVPFDGRAAWDFQIDEAAGEDSFPDDQELEDDDADGAEIDYDAHHRRAAEAHVEYFARLVKDEIGIDLSLRLKHHDEDFISAEMPMIVAELLLADEGGRSRMPSPEEWEALLVARLRRDDVAEEIFEYLAESTDVFLP